MNLFYFIYTRRRLTLELLRIVGPSLDRKTMPAARRKQDVPQATAIRIKTLRNLETHTLV